MQTDTFLGSYLDDKTRFAPGTPRWGKHFYALTLRELGENIFDDAQDRVTRRFFVTSEERDEFEELAGVRSVTLTDSFGAAPIVAAIETWFFGVYEMNGHNLRLVLRGYESAKSAHEGLAEVQASPLGYAGCGIFFSDTPWVASQGSPAIKIAATGEEVCRHTAPVAKVLSDNSIVHDCGGCGEALVEVRGEGVTLPESVRD